MSRAPPLPPDLRVQPFQFGDEAFVLVSFPARVDGAPACLGEAHREIFALLRAGWSCQEIARYRGTSVHTVRKQAAAMYRAVGVSGRSEFLARFAPPSAG